MIALVIAACDLRLRLRDTSFWLEVLALPLVVTLILGVALGGLRGGNLPKTLVVYVNTDLGTAGEILTDVLTGSSLLNVATLPTENEAEQGLRSGKYHVLVYLPKGATDALQQGHDITIRVLASTGHEVGASLVRDMVTAALDNFRTQMAARRAVADALTAAGEDAQGAWIAQTGIPVAASIKALSVPRYDAVGVYASGMAVFFVLLTALRLAGILKQQLQGGAADRIEAAPLSPWAVVVGRLLSLGLVGLLQMTTMMLSARVFFHIQMGTPLAIASVTLVSVFAAVAVALAFTAIPVRKENRGGLSAVFVTCSALLGGSFVPLDSAPGWTHWVAALTYNFWASSAFRLVASGETVSGWIRPVATLALYGALAFVGAALLGARRMVRA